MGIFKKIILDASKDLINEGKSLLNQVTSSQMAENVKKVQENVKKTVSISSSLNNEQPVSVEIIKCENNTSEFNSDAHVENSGLDLHSKNSNKLSENKNPMYCPNCNLEFDSKFCPECGAKLVEKVVMYCPNCGIETDSKFCPECGTKIVRKTGDITETQSSTLPPIPGIPEIPKANTVAPPSIPIKSEIPIKNVDFETSDDNIKKYTTNGVFRIPDGVTNIIDGGYSDKRETVKEIILPNTLRKIEYEAFNCFVKIQRLELPSSLVEIGAEAFSHCTGLTEVTIGNSVTTIDNYAFRDCSGLTSVTIPNSVTTIGDGAFKYCECLTSVTIPNSVTEIGESSFFSCPIETLVWKAKSIKQMDYQWVERDFIKQVVISEDVEVIPENFLSDTLIESLVIPNSVIIIGDFAFNNCRQLKKVKFGNNVERIGESAFMGCPLEQISLPESLVEIGADAFSEYNFDQLVIPDSVVTIGEYAFGWGDHLHNATIGKSAKNYFNQSRPIFGSCGELTELTVRSEVAEYTGVKSLTKITICDTVKELGKWAFSECPNLEEVVVPDSVTKIGYGAFVKDENLKTIELSDSITEIGEGAFSGTRLKEIVFPKELSKIGRLGGDMYKLRKLDFSKVTRLRVIPEDFLGDCPKVKELVIPMGVITIEENIGGDNLNDLFLPPTIEEIEELHQADLNIYCFAPEMDELEPLTGGVDVDNSFHPNHLFVLPQYLDAYKGQQVAEGVSEELLIIDIIPEEYQYYYEN